MTTYVPINLGSHWAEMNNNLIELVDLIPDDGLDWAPRRDEWSTGVILTHLILGRYFGPLLEGVDGAEISAVVAAGHSREGLKDSLRKSWEMVASFISDPAKLDAAYDLQSGNSGMYNDPEIHDGHYFAYHRLAHELHHRSTFVGYLSELGVNLDGRRIRPL